MSYTPEAKAFILDALISHLGAGGMLRVFARDFGIAFTTLYTWEADADAELKARFAHARACGYECLAEETIDIIDGTHEHKTYDVVRDKARAHVRLQLLSKWAHVRYGDRSRVDHAGVPNQPITIVTGVPQVEPPPLDEPPPDLLAVFG
jgi:hypothetical protein